MDSKYGYLILTLMLLAAAIGKTGCVQAQDLSYSGSIQYATGSYFFDESTNSFSWSNGFGISGQNLTVSFSVPFIVQNSPWISYGAAGYLPTGGPQHQVVRDSSRGGGGTGGMHMKGLVDESHSTARRYGRDPVVLPDTTDYTQSSFGDPNIYANLKMYTSNSGRTSIQVNSGLKLPFADPANGFGTGEWDYGLGISASQRISNYFLYLNLMQWWFGDMDELELKDPLTYSIGLSRSLAGGSWLINTTFNGYTEIIEDYDPPLNVGFGIGYFVSDRVSLNSSLLFGLTESASDVSFGVGWTVKL